MRRCRRLRRRLSFFFRFGLLRACLVFSARTACPSASWRARSTRTPRRRSASGRPPPSTTSTTGPLPPTRPSRSSWLSSLDRGGLRLSMVLPVASWCAALRLLRVERRDVSMVDMWCVVGLPVGRNGCSFGVQLSCGSVLHRRPPPSWFSFPTRTCVQVRRSVVVGDVCSGCGTASEVPWF